MTDPAVRPTYCTVDLGALTRNITAIENHVGPASQVMPVLKADAYGHGLALVVPHLEGLGVGRIAVAYVEEGIEARRLGFTGIVHVLGGAVESQIGLFLDHDLTFTVPSIDKLVQVATIAHQRGMKPAVHLKIDTGMERIGVHYQNAHAFFEQAYACDDLVVEGVFSHFANADSADLDDARRQLERFVGATDLLGDLAEPPIRHIANSGAIAQLPESHLDLVRPGVLTYGLYPSRETVRALGVEPVLSWMSTVVYFKVVAADSSVGYGSTWAPSRQTRVVTLPVGYGDGYPRAASNSAEVLIRGTRYPVVGRVCMDQTMIDIGDGTAYNGDQVVLVGSQGQQSITVEDLADRCGTIPYEILTRITARVPRVGVG
ncbi:MAG: alanine racemase [Actinomycetia bacterium]|nr:alanine racemase [Actinomycetes bacterium]MCP4963193.1 alanine racemase [Actinomycetes bacterium]